MAEQAGPMMVRHTIDGHDVLLPADAVLAKRLRHDWPLCMTCLGEGGGGCVSDDIWVCGDCGGVGQLPPSPST